MDRITFQKEMRRLAEERYDFFAPDYDEKWGIFSNATHKLFIQEFLNFLPQQSVILDAACGTGKYWPMLFEEGHTVVGIDQSKGMLQHAKMKFPTVQVEKIGLQEISYHEMFDGIICMDAMEFIFPEDWPVILGNFHKALRPNRHLYYTVELADANEIQTALDKGLQLGFPVVYGEAAHENGYHYYPEIEHVKEWTTQAGFSLIDETIGDKYRHFIMQKK